MKKISIFLFGFSGLLKFVFFLAPFLASAQTFQLTVQNGYGTGQYAAGDTVHIWSEEWPLTKTFSHWTGQTSFLQMADEWHTRLVMPAQNVTVTGHIKNLLPGADFTEEHFMGRDTLQQVFYYLQFVIEHTDTPILFSMTIRDQHPDVGPVGNMEAFANFQYQISKGNCSQFYMLLPSPLYPQRFMRIPGINAAKSLGIFKEFQHNGCLNSKNFFITAPNDIIALISANPQNWPTLLSLNAQQLDFLDV